MSGAPTDPPIAFVERCSRWTGRAWLEVHAAGGVARRAAGPGYREARDRLRRSHPFVPWSADWGDGTFDPAPWGLPGHPVAVGAAGLAASGVTAAALAGGPLAAAGAAALALAPFLRLLDHASVTAAGIRLGPAWAARIGWADVERVGLHAAGGRTRVWFTSRYGGAVVDVPPAVAPAVRARLRRFSGLPPELGDGGADLRYARGWAAATGVPWGVALGTALACPLAADPFAVAFAGGLVATALGALGAATTARGSGWGAGAVFWSTVAFAVVLAGVAIGGRWVP